MNTNTTKKRLVVFAGKPGVGKSSIIEKVRHGWTVIDVWHFIVPQIESGEAVPPEWKNVVAYEALYEYIEALDVPRLIVELGTNYPVMNTLQLVRLLHRYEIDVLLCDVRLEVCRERLHSRGYRGSGEGIERRLQRDFPGAFLRELKRTPLRHHLIDTEGDIDTVCRKIQEQFIYP